MAFPASVNASFMASTSWPWALVSARPIFSACSRALAMPSAPPANSGSSWAPDRPKIWTAAAARSASVGRAAMDDAIASNRSAAFIPESCCTVRPRFAKADVAVFEPCDALTNATSAFVAAAPIVSRPTPARSPARAIPASSP